MNEQWLTKFYSIPSRKFIWTPLKSTHPLLLNRCQNSKGRLILLAIDFNYRAELVPLKSVSSSDFPQFFSIHVNCSLKASNQMQLEREFSFLIFRLTSHLKKFFSSSPLIQWQISFYIIFLFLLERSMPFMAGSPRNITWEKQIECERKSKTFLTFSPEIQLKSLRSEALSIDLVEWIWLIKLSWIGVRLKWKTNPRQGRSRREQMLFLSCFDWEGLWVWIIICFHVNSNWKLSLERPSIPMVH